MWKQLSGRKPALKIMLATLLPLAGAQAQDSDLLKRLAGFDALGQEVVALAARIEALLKPGAVPATPEPHQAKLAGAKARLDAAAKAYAALTAALLALPAGEADTTVLTRALEGEALLAALGETGRILVLKVLAGGGTSLVDEHNFRPDEIRHSGGSVATFLLLDGDGAVQKADVVHGYSGLVTSEMKDAGDKLGPFIGS